MQRRRPPRRRNTRSRPDACRSSRCRASVTRRSPARRPRQPAPLRQTPGLRRKQPSLPPGRLWPMLRRPPVKWKAWRLEPEQADFLAPLAGEEVDAVHEAHPVAARAHEEGMRAGAVGEEADAAQQVAVRDAGRRDDHLARSEVVGIEDALVVLDPGLAELPDLRAGRGSELRDPLAAEAAQRGRRENRLPGAADPDRQVVVRAADRGGDRRGHVAVLDELDPGAGVADLLDQVVVAGPVEDDRRHVVDAPSEGLRDRLDVLSDWAHEVDRAPGTWAYGHLPHVDVGQRREAARLADGDHRHRAVAAPSDDAAAFERVEREVDLGPSRAD